MRTMLAAALLFLVSACTAINPVPSDYSPLEAQFNAIRHNTPMLVDFLDDFPKGADLHNHASGAAYIEYGLIYAAEKGLYYDLKKLQVVQEDTGNPDAIVRKYPADSPEYAAGCGGWMKGRPCLITVQELLVRNDRLEEYLNVSSVRGWHENAANGLDHFFDAFSHKTKEDTNRSLARILARNHSQGVRYVELMTSSFNSDLVDRLESLVPENSFSMANLEESYAKLVSYLNSPEFETGVVLYMDNREKAVDAILREQYDLTSTGETPDIVVRYIPQLYRLSSLYSIFINAAASLKASQLDERVVATNMVQAESGIPSLLNFDGQMKILDFLWQKLDKPNIALHAGELVLRESPLEPMRDRISKSVSMGHASRIGHGISIAWETDTRGTLQMMRDTGVAVEICLSSNDIILGVKGKDHPIAMYMQAGVPITIATDDEGISRSNLTMEYVKAAQEHGLGYATLKRIAKNGLEYSFLDGETIYYPDGCVKEMYQEYLTGELPGVSKVGTKAYLQIRHERDLAAFEGRVLSGL